MKTETHMFTKGIRLAVTLALVSMFSCAHASLLLDRIVAVVESDVVTESELNERMSVIKAQSGPQTNLPSDDILAEQVQQRIII